MKRIVGIPIAFDAEAWCLLGARRWRRFDGRAVCTTPSRYGVDLVALRSGVGMEKALEGARWLVKSGVGALVSIGIAGGLHPDVETGDLIVGDKIIEQGNGEANEQWEPDQECMELAHDALLFQGIQTRKGPIVSVRTPASSAREKAELYRGSHALVSDMESGSIARAATESNMPFMALRVVIDPPGRKLEPDLSCCLDETGKVCFPILWRNLRRRPSLLPELLRMTGDLFIALSALRRGWGVQLRRTLPVLVYKGRRSEFKKLRCSV